jgi:protocatechuate 3,4-dioxygenase beta subunit
MLKDSGSPAKPAPAATRPAFYPLAGLDEAIRQYKKGLDPVEQERLKKMDDSWKQDIERGWKPPWSHLAAKLTDQEIESLSTAELGRRLFDNGLPARTLILYNSTNTGIKRLEVLYKGYKELFHRPDCWKGLIASLDYYAAQLAVSGKATDNVNAIAGLMTVPKFYGYPAIRVNITGHEREIIAAHVRALRRISAYLNASAASTGKGQHEAFFAPMAPSDLINWALALGQGLSEQQYQAARAALANPKWAKGIPAGEVRAYIDEAALMLEMFTIVPPATQPAPAGTTTQPARQFRLILLDDAGKPVEGADVVLGNSSDKENGRPAAVTDSHGRCSIPVGTMQADYWGPKITKPGYVPMEGWLGKAEAEKLFAEETTLCITKGRTIGGVVRDESGQPIKGVILGFWYNPNKPRQAVRDDMDLIPVRTDADGKWVCDFAPPEFDDSFCIFLRHPQYVSDYWGNSIPSAKYPRPSNEDLLSGKAVYVMKAGVVLTGKVTDAQSNPVSGAQVRIMEGSGFGYDARAVNAQRTKVDGSFMFKNAEGERGSVIVTAKGFAPDIFPFDMGKDAPLVIRLAPGGIIRGKLIDARGMPIQGAFVYVKEWREQDSLLRWDTRTDKDGCFVWSDAPTDGATFCIYQQGYMRQDDVALKPLDTEQLITLSDPLRITGRVLDTETGKPIDARVIYGIDYGRRSPPTWQRQTQTPVKDGKYEMEITDSYNAFVLRAQADGYKPAVSESIPRDAGRKTVDFKMVKGKPIVGRVLDPDGNPIAGVDVRAATVEERVYISNCTKFENVGNTVKVTTAADGSFSLPPDDQDSTIVVAIDAGYAEVGSADLAKTPEVRLAPWGRIEGVVKQGSKPLPNASVGASAIGSSQMPIVYHNLRVTADAQGRFVMPRVPPGQYQVHRMMRMGNVGFYICHENVTVEAGKMATVTLGGKGRMIVGNLRRDVGDGEMNSANAVILDAASMAIGQMDFRPDNWNKMDSAQRAKWEEQWRQSEEGKAFMRLSQEIQEKSKCIGAVVYPGGKLEAYDVPPGQYVLNVSLSRVVGGQYVSEGTVKHPFEVPPIKGNDLDTPLDLGTLKVVPPAVTPADIAVAKVPAVTGGTRVTIGGPDGPISTIVGGTATPAQQAPAAVDAASVLNKPLKLDLDAGLAGKKLLVVAASIEQRPSRRILDMLAASQASIAKQGFAVALVHPAVTDEKQVRQWIADHKLDVTQLILAKDQSDAASLMTACGAESLPFMLLTDDKHLVKALDIQPDKLGTLGDIPAASQQPTTSPAPSAGRQPTTSPADAAAGGNR